NLDFRKLNTDTANIVPAFKPIATDCKIEFRLATKDPLGNCTNGIIHHLDPNTHAWDGDGQDYVYTWDPTKYLNIYVVRVITFGAAGYTYLPGTVFGPEDAIVILQDYTGSIGTGQPFKSRALTHEVGHWLGLEHVWGWSNSPGVSCGDDGIPDTPLTEGHQSCNLNSQICTPGIIENVQNYMEYAYCSNMFTNDQSTLMQNILGFPGFNRDNLSSLPNLAFTGVMNPSTCVPVSDFNSANLVYEVCSGNSLLFKDYSTNGAVTSYSWAATGSATLTTPTFSSTNIFFPNPGMYTVSLQVQNSAGSSISTKTVNALNGAANYASAYVESFETGISEPTNWTIINPDAGTTWAKHAGIASNGSSSFFIEGQNNPPLQEDYLKTGIFNLQANPSASLTFDVSYARASATHNDIFKVQASKDCEATWIDIYSPSMANLAGQTGGTSPGGFTPIASQWKTVELHNYPAYAAIVNQSSVVFRFYFKEDGVDGFGNRIFIDNLNFTPASVGMNELSLQAGYEIYPNPASQSSTVKFIIQSASKVSVKVMDVKGSLVKEIQASEYTSGEHALQLHNAAELSQGMYLVELRINELKLVKKLIIR
ncbi:MAG: hypothetical protein K0S32_1487, partial [Bacteroidetes bacterium]|nr:hypothetical protein [Bacteroidota bacterium]